MQREQVKDPTSRLGSRQRGPDPAVVHMMLFCRRSSPARMSHAAQLLAPDRAAFLCLPPRAVHGLRWAQRPVSEVSIRSKVPTVYLSNMSESSRAAHDDSVLGWKHSPMKQRRTAGRAHNVVSQRAALSRLYLIQKEAHSGQQSGDRSSDGSSGVQDLCAIDCDNHSIEVAGVKSLESGNAPYGPP